MGKPEFVAPGGSEGEGWRGWPGRAGGNASALGGGLGWTPFKVYSGLEKICVSVLLNSREKNWPTRGKGLVITWMAAGFGERIVIVWVGWGVRCS